MARVKRRKKQEREPLGEREKKRFPWEEEEEKKEEPLTWQQEAFARAYAETGIALEAYRRAHKNCPLNTSTIAARARRLLAMPQIQARVRELCAKKAAKVEQEAKRAELEQEITIERLTRMTLDAYEMACENAQASAAIKAAEFLGKLHGLIIERKEVGEPGDFSRMSRHELQQYIRERVAALSGRIAPLRIARANGDAGDVSH